MKMRRVNFHITEFQLTKIKAVSQCTGLSMAEILRRLIDSDFEEMNLTPNTETENEKANQKEYNQ